jgi:hypothetical protein
MPFHHLPARFRHSSLAACLHGSLSFQAATVAGLAGLALPMQAQAQAPAAATSDAAGRSYRIAVEPLAAAAAGRTRAGSLPCVAPRLSFLRYPPDPPR